MSHIVAKKASVAAVKKALAPFAIDCFVAHQDIQPTKEWIAAILDALDSCNALAAFLTEGFHESNWTDQEIGYCINRRILLVPIKYDLVPYGFISRYQALTPIDRTPESVATALFDLLVQHELTAPQMAEALVTQFEGSRSFLKARHNVQLLERIPAWTPDLLTRIGAAVQNNYEIRDSTNVPERVNRLVERHGR
jgi:hypothetical protein